MSPKGGRPALARRRGSVKLSPMAKRDNRYEAAFEEFLRQRRVPYVAVDELRRSLWTSAPGAPTSLKNLDFIVPAGRDTWLVDVKGRRFPSGRQRRFWRNWSTRDDLCSLSRWEALFGPRFAGLLVFAYEVSGDRAPVAEEQLYEYRGQAYGFLAVRLTHYAAHARVLSPRWDTVSIPVGEFRRLARPLVELL